LTVFAWLIGFLLPACGAEGAAGLPVPMLMDMTKIERPATPNTFLAGPAGMLPAPDAVTEEQNLPAPVLYERVRVLFGAQPSTFVAAEFPVQLQIHYVVRSKLMNYPDLVTVQVNAAGPNRSPDRSSLAIWSRSVYGRSDLGVNRDRTMSWLALLQQPNQR
jgi:hypothetical protein